MSQPASTPPGGASRAPLRRVPAALAVILALMGAGPGAASTAFVMKSGGTMLLAKNFDGPLGDGYIFVNKRGVAKEAFGGPDSPPLRWVSKYGSVTFNQFGREFPLGGINEAGLVVEALDGPAGYPSRDARPGLAELQWVQYQLDNHRTVKDVLRSDGRLRVFRLLLDLHFLVADGSGKTAVVEFAAGGMVSYTGNELSVRVLSEDGYAESVRHLKTHRGFGGDQPASNGPEPGERFVRAATLVDDFDWTFQGAPSDYAFPVLKSVEREDTRWSIVYNIPRRLVFFKTRVHRRLKIVSLDALDFSCAGPVLMLPVETEAGWVLTGNFEPYDPAKNRLLLETAFRKLKDPGGAANIPAADIVRRLAEYPETCRCR